VCNRNGEVINWKLEERLYKLHEEDAAISKIGLLLNLNKKNIRKVEKQG
jgi:hypothetical protein